jgi:hypothetical protein
MTTEVDIQEHRVLLPYRQLALYEKELVLVLTARHVVEDSSLWLETLVLWCCIK